MPDEALIARTRDAIGPAQEREEPICPDVHSKDFERDAPFLALVLRRADVGAIAKQYRLADLRAREAQHDFKRHSKLAGWLVVATASASATILAAGNLAGDNEVLGRALGTVLSVAGLATAAASSALIGIIRGRKLLEKWMQNRAEAESKRLEYFTAITGPSVDGGTTPSKPRDWLELLEFFRRFQLNGQRMYYERQAVVHQRDARRAVIMSSVLIAAAGFAHVVAGFLGVAIQAEWTAVAAIAVLAQSLASRSTNAEAISQDGRNAERYQRTTTVLLKLEGKLDKVRRATFAGKEGVLTAFVEAVHNQLSLEHRQWLDTAKGAGPALDRLSAELEKAEGLATAAAEEGGEGKIE